MLYEVHGIEGGRYAAYVYQPWYASAFQAAGKFCFWGSWTQRGFTYLRLCVMTNTLRQVCAKGVSFHKANLFRCFKRSVILESIGFFLNWLLIQPSGPTVSLVRKTSFLFSIRAIFFLRIESRRFLSVMQPCRFSISVLLLRIGPCSFIVRTSVLSMIDAFGSLFGGLRVSWQTSYCFILILRISLKLFIYISTFISEGFYASVSRKH